MNRLFTLIGAGLLAGGIAAAGPAERQLTVGQIGMKMADDAKAIMKASPVESTSSVTPMRLKSPNKAASVQREIELLYEDFDNVPEGNTEVIGDPSKGWNRYTDYIASHYYEPGRYVDSSYTPDSGTWEGDFVMAGKGGTIVLQAYNPYIWAYIATPLGEYSGDLTVKVRCRYSRPFYGANNEIGYETSYGSALTVAVRYGGYDKASVPVTDAGLGQIGSGQIYENEGWMELTFNIRNECASNDGFIELGTTEAIEIDWVKIIDNTTYLAAPTVKGITEYNNDNFTIAWDMVRRSYNYYIDLWKVKYLSDSEIDTTYDFEDGALPEGWTADEGEVEDGIGYNDSKGFRFGYCGPEAALTTPNLNAAIKSMSFRVYYDVDDSDRKLSSPEYGFGTIIIEGLTDDGWQPVTSDYCDGRWTKSGYYYKNQVRGEAFEGKYKAIRFYTMGVQDGYNIYLDDIQICAERPYVLERVIPEDGYLSNPDDDDDAYNKYDRTDNPSDPCVYTFTDLDPNADYWYRVRSHYVHDFAGKEKIFALGVASPTILTPTDVTTSGYTANWQDAPKAQNYVVKNYGIEIKNEDETDAVIFFENFSKCEGSDDWEAMESIGNAEGYLDDYTDMPGWTGSNNTFGEWMIGGTVTSPAIPVNPERGAYYVYVEAYGYTGDTLYIEFLNAGEQCYATFEDDFVSGFLEIPAFLVKANEQIRFSSYNHMPYALVAIEVTQDVKAGDMIRTFLGESVVPAGIQQCTFSGLDENGMYGYQVFSRYDINQQTAYSLCDDMMIVNLADGGSHFATTTDEAIEAAATEEARFDINGMPVKGDYKGVMVVKMSDGTYRKAIAK